MQISHTQNKSLTDPKNSNITYKNIESLLDHENHLANIQVASKPPKKYK